MILCKLYITLKFLLVIYLTIGIIGRIDRSIILSELLLQFDVKFS